MLRLVTWKREDVEEYVKSQRRKGKIKTLQKYEGKYVHFGKQIYEKNKWRRQVEETIITYMTEENFSELKKT